MQSLRSRLFASTLVVSLLAVGVALAIGIALTRSNLRDTIKDDVRREATVVAERVPADAGLAPEQGQGQGRPQLPPGFPRGVPPPAGGLGGSGDDDLPGGGPPGGGQRPRVLPNSQASSVLPASAAAAVQKKEKASGIATISGEKRIYATAPVASNDDNFVLATRPDDLGSSNYGGYLAGLLIAAAVAALLAAIAAALLSRRLVAPLQKVVAATKQLAAGGKPDPLPIEGTSELAELSGSFNEMTTQLAHAREAERTILMSASHELRTPLTSIRGYAEGIQDGAIEPKQAADVIARETNRLERLVGDLLALARLDQGVLDVRREQFDLGAVAHDAVKRLEPQARHANVQLVVDANDDANVLADRERSLQVLSNLIDNAIRVTPPGGSVTVVSGRGRLTVTDTGPGLPEADLPNAFERFHLRRVAGIASGEGSGIGLAIVRELTERMGGTVSVENVPGAGARFTIELPRA